MLNPFTRYLVVSCWVNFIVSLVGHVNSAVWYLTTIVSNFSFFNAIRRAESFSFRNSISFAQPGETKGKRDIKITGAGHGRETNNANQFYENNGRLRSNPAGDGGGRRNA